MDAHQLILQAHRRDELRAAATPRVDYEQLNKMVRRQRAALTRAINTGDRDKVILTAAKAVREWNQPGAMWPDDWSRWQRAIDDVLPLHQQIRIEDLA